MSLVSCNSCFVQWKVSKYFASSSVTSLMFSLEICPESLNVGRHTGWAELSGAPQVLLSQLKF